MNSRPLTALNSHNIDGITTLTPGHFLIGRPLSAYPETVINTEPSLLKRWTMCQATVHHFWKRWSSEYLQQLQARSKWRKTSPNLQVGDVVVLRDDTPFTCHWPVARITETFPGADGLVRVVMLKTVSFGKDKPSSKAALIKAQPAFMLLKRPATKAALIHRDDPTDHLSVSSETGVSAPPPQDVQAPKT